MGCGKNPQRRWILDADLTAAFDKIGHDHLLAKLGSFPGKGKIRGWLKAGVFEKGKGFAPTDEGTPQGGVISPCLLNIALHGLEEAAGVRYEASDPARTKRGCPALVVYADDMVALCHTRQQAEQVKWLRTCSPGTSSARAAPWLATAMPDLDARVPMNRRDLDRRPTRSGDPRDALSCRRPGAFP